VRFGTFKLFLSHYEAPSMFRGLTMAQFVFRAANIALRTKNQAGVLSRIPTKHEFLATLR
ncbi:hypothetical protein, partial [Cognatishimia activa]|uniref:hypothetical protein n=1 Tax=Cognatishimia activa TaxID=1715691 RepID=UPI00071E3766